MKKPYEIIIKDNCYDSVIIREYNQLLEVSFHLIHSKKPFEVESVNYRIMYNLNDSLARWTSQPGDYVSAESIEQAIKTIKKLIGVQKAYIKNSTLHPAYNVMNQIVKEQVKHFASDFKTHDKIQLGKNTRDSFLWLVRSTGTWFIKNTSRFNDAIIEQELRENRSLFFWYNGSEIKEISKDEVKHYYHNFKES